MKRHLVICFALAACQSAPKTSSTPPADAINVQDPSDNPIVGIQSQDLTVFRQGDNLFDTPLMNADGLGPLYSRTSCGDCHSGGARGPDGVQKMVVVEADGKTPSADQSKLPWGHNIRPLTTAGATTAIVPPANDPTIRTSIRTGPPIFGRGYMEAVADSEIERMAAEQTQRTDGIKGHINHVVFASVPNPDTTFHDYHTGDVLIGRFGDKARIASIDEFVADAFQGDMGITSPMRPDELPNPDGLTDDDKPGVDVSMASIDSRATYVRFNAIPKRGDDTGSAQFSAAHCDVCHASALQTSASYPIAPLANITVAVFTDFLLHDMGDGLADSMVDIDGEAGPRDWRTAPLIGMRFSQSFLHDSRAHSIAEAIAAHASPGSEANDSVSRFNALSASDQQALIDFVNGL